MIANFTDRVKFENSRSEKIAKIRKANGQKGPPSLKLRTGKKGVEVVSVSAISPQSEISQNRKIFYPFKRKNGRGGENQN